MMLSLQTLLIVTALVLIMTGAAIVAASNELIRVLLGMEVMFLGATVSLVLLYFRFPALSFSLLLVCLGAAVGETVIMIGIIYRMVKLGYRATVSFKEKYSEE